MPSAEQVRSTVDLPVQFRRLNDGAGSMPPVPLSTLPKVNNPPTAAELPVAAIQEQPATEQASATQTPLPESKPEDLEQKLRRMSRTWESKIGPHKLKVHDFAKKAVKSMVELGDQTAQKPKNEMTEPVAPTAPEQANATEVAAKPEQPSNPTKRVYFANKASDTLTLGSEINYSGLQIAHQQFVEAHSDGVDALLRTESGKSLVLLEAKKLILLDDQNTPRDFWNVMPEDDLQVTIDNSWGLLAETEYADEVVASVTFAGKIDKSTLESAASIDVNQLDVDPINPFEIARAVSAAQANTEPAAATTPTDEAMTEEITTPQTEDYALLKARANLNAHLGPTWLAKAPERAANHELTEEAVQYAVPATPAHKSGEILSATRYTGKGELDLASLPAALNLNRRILINTANEDGTPGTAYYMYGDRMHDTSFKNLDGTFGSTELGVDEPLPKLDFEKGLQLPTGITGKVLSVTILSKKEAKTDQDKALVANIGKEEANDAIARQRITLIDKIASSREQLRADYAARQKRAQSARQAGRQAVSRTGQFMTDRRDDFAMRNESEEIKRQLKTNRRQNS